MPPISLTPFLVPLDSQELSEFGSGPYIMDGFGEFWSTYQRIVLGKLLGVQFFKDQILWLSGNLGNKTYGVESSNKYKEIE